MLYFDSNFFQIGLKNVFTENLFALGAGGYNYQNRNRIAWDEVTGSQDQPRMSIGGVGEKKKMDEFLLFFCSQPSKSYQFRPLFAKCKFQNVNHFNQNVNHFDDHFFQI